MHEQDKYEHIEENVSVGSNDDSINSQSHSQNSLNSDPNSQPSTQAQIIDRLPPITSQIRSIPIPSQNILPKEDYKDYKGRRQFQYQQNGALILNSHNLKLLCLKDGLYQFPQMNNKLYLHFKCIEKISNLQEYINVKTLYLENNVITKIQGLQKLPLLENLFLQNNMIKTIEGLEHNHQLRVINLSYNNIFKIQNLADLRMLQVLTISNNYLRDFESLQGLGQCSSQLTSIDISHNQIVGDLRILNLIPQVKLLYFSGNLFCRDVEHYRRMVIGKLKNLLYLDQRAVSQQQRMIAQTFVQKGRQGVKEIKKVLEQKKIQQKIQKKQEIMKDINVHRERKIKTFSRDIKDLQQQIKKLEEYLQDDSCQDMWHYYQTHIDEKKKKVQQLQGHIKNITDRIQGKLVKKVQQNNQQTNPKQKDIDSQKQNQQENINEDFQQNTNQHIKQNINEDIKENINEDFQQNTNQDIKENINEDIKENINEDFQQNTNQDIKENISNKVNPQICKAFQKQYQSPFHKKNSSLIINTAEESSQISENQMDTQMTVSPANSMKRQGHKVGWGTVQTKQAEKQQKPLKITTRMGAQKYDYDQLD